MLLIAKRIKPSLLQNHAKSNYERYSQPLQYFIFKINGQSRQNSRLPRKTTYPNKLPTAVIEVAKSFR